MNVGSGQQMAGSRVVIMVALGAACLLQATGVAGAHQTSARTAASAPAPVLDCPSDTAPLPLVSSSLDAAGGAHYSFLDSAGHTVEEAIVPPGFDTSTASDAALSSYLLPTRSNPQWSQIKGSAANTGPLHSPCASTIGKRATQNYNNWSGYTDDAGAAWNGAGANWFVPSLNSACPSATQTTWVGIGDGNARSGKLIQNGWNGGTNDAWWEYVGPGNGGVAQQYPNLYSRPGDYVYAQTSYNGNGSVSFTWRDVNLNTLKTTNVTGIAGYYDSTTTEFISERLTVNGSLSNLQQHTAVQFSTVQSRDTGNAWHNGQTVPNENVNMFGNSFAYTIETPTAWQSTSQFTSNQSGPCS